MNALRFTPAGYPAEIFSAQVHIFDGTWPPGNVLTPFQVAIYDDDGEDGLPGTELVVTTFTPYDYGWVDVDFSQFAVSIPDGDFYVVMIQGGEFPDCAPIAIDESNPVYRSYSKNVSAGMPWEPAEFADFMMRAFVYSEVDGAQILSYNDKIDIPESETNALSIFGSNIEPGTYDVGFGRFIPKGEIEDLRDFDHYEVWVLSEGDELEPESWTLKDDAVLGTEYTDTDWTTYEQGFYRYAVVSRYTYNQSEPAFSNVLKKGLDHSVTLMVRTNNGDPAVGAHVIFNQNDDPAWQYEGYTDEMGRVHFQEVWEGYYTLEVFLDYFNPYTQLNIPVYNDTTLNIELTETFLPPQDFHVNSMNGKTTWLPPVSYYDNVIDKARVLEGYNLYMEDTLVAFTTELTFTYTNLMIGQEYIAGIEAQYTDGKSTMVTFPFTYYTCDCFIPPTNFAGWVMGMEVALAWDPSYPYPDFYDIIYDDSTMENAVAWNEENGEFAVRFTPAAYPCDLVSFIMHIWDGSWPEGDILSPFVINIYDDDGPDGAPGTLLGSLERTPENYDWVTFDITELGITVNSGDFYFAHQQIGTFPDVPPTAVDESSAGQGRSYSRIPPDPWMPETTYDQLAIRAGVYGLNFGDMILSPTTIEITGKSVVDKTESVHEPPLRVISGEVELAHGTFVYTNGSNRFDFLGYDVYRNQKKINDTLITINSFIDVVSPGGVYYYNVLKVYDMGESCPMDPPFEAIVGAEFFFSTDFSGTLLENEDVLLTWNIPGEQFWLHWDDGENFYSIGLTSGGNFLVASRWEEEELAFYHGMIMTEVAFFPTDSNTTYVLKVWTGDNAGNLIVSQPLSNLSINQWNTVVLNTPVEINAFEELWFGYENIDQPAGEHSAGTDDGPAIAGYGDMISMDGATWDPLSSFGLDYNWNLQAYVEIDGDAIPLTTIIQEPIHNTGEVSLEASKSAGGVFDENQREVLLGYNLWRNGNMIAYVPEPDTFYLDFPGPGMWDYYISAVFDEGESFTEGPAEVEILNDGSITGIVYDAFSLVPLQGATVTLDTSGIEIITDENGKYDFTDVEVGSYFVKASATGYNNGSAYEVDVIYNDVVTADLFLYSDSVILPVPFYEPWNEEFTAQYWTFDPEPGNWRLVNYLGNPLPVVEFYFSPATTGYSYTLQSIGIDARMATPNVVLEFDLYMNDYSSTGLEFLTVEVWNGTDWVYIDEYANNGDIEWDHKFYNITDYALGIITKVRFIAHGANSYAINNWAIDNILVSETTLSSMQGYVTDEESGDPIEAAMIEVGSNLPVYTDEEGFYSIGVLESTYSVICSADGYLPELVENIFITGVVSQDFALEMEACDPPENLTAVIEGFWDVRLNWESPGGIVDTWIHYDDGVNYSSIGACDGCSFLVAIRFEPSQLEPYAGTMLTEVAIFVNGPYAGYELMIWTGENAANLIYSQILTGNLIIEEWNTISLSTPIPIDITQELWIGYAVIDQSAGEFPAGCDEGPAFTGYGDMINHDGVVWETLSNFGINYNWNIQGHVVDIDGEIRELFPLQQVTINNSATSKPVEGLVNTSPGSIGPAYGARSLLGFNVYRNYVQINESLVLETTYFDEGLTYGMYEYYVTAVYTLCESEPSNVEVVFWFGIDDLLGSNIKVYPIPATNFVNVEVPEGICKIRMVNYLGDIVYVRNLEMEKSLRIRTGAYSSGIYLLEFIAENGSIITKRIIITK